MQRPGTKTSPVAGWTRAVILFLLLLFSTTSFLTLVLTAIAARKYPQTLNDVIVRNPLFFIDTTRLPYIFLAFISALSWLVSLLAILFLTSKINPQNTRFARYVFKIAVVLTAILLVIFYFSWVATSLTFIFPFAAKWHCGSAAVVVAHINLFLAITLTLVAAVFDIPKDSKPDGPNTPMGPGSRTSSQAQ
ncbi:hypothetical protein FLONG3_10472 [Fusarium longipes]|uniref:Uncharacterized protein n=1 Tax=Fusarium longipes TaxID=694270 RepID=A0A395RP39_9HYPO|nr:hypothetical protein FLONG3_10472 [Fusarium longipes]